MFKKFKSITGDIYVSNIDGHSAIIGKALTPIHQSLWALAYAQGAIPEDLVIPNEDNPKAFIREKAKALKEERQQALDEFVEKLKEVAENPVGRVDKSNRPIMRKILTLIPVLEPALSSAELDNCWARALEAKG